MNIETYYLNQPEPNGDGWLISDWDMFSPLTEYQADNVIVGPDYISLVLDDSGNGDPYAGGEIQRTKDTRYGEYSWEAMAPEMVDGAVFGLFTYQADWRDEWLEFDYEFVGADTTEVQITVHMTINGVVRHESEIVELGFDAAKAFHKYEVNISQTEAIFEVDNVQVAKFDASRMGGWVVGDMHSYADLWASDAEGWTGEWTGEHTLTGYVRNAYVPGDVVPPVDPEPDPDPEPPTVNTVIGTDGNDKLMGSDGMDVLIGGYGRDVMNAFDDTAEDVFVIEGAGTDILANFGRREDVIEFDMDVFELTDGPAQNAVWIHSDKGRHITLRYDQDRDPIYDGEIIVRNVWTVTADDFIFA